MTKYVIYDSVFNNTEKVAQEIADKLEARLINVNNFTTKKFEAGDLIVIGSPTHAGRPTDEIQKFLGKINNPKDLKIAAFDTRSNLKWARIFGFASDRIFRHFEKLGAKIVSEPQGFFVNSKEGPLLKTEINRAGKWAIKLRKF